MTALVEFFSWLFNCDFISDVDDDNETEIEANAMISQSAIAESLKDH